MKKRTRRKAGLPRSEWKRFGLMLDAIIEHGIREHGNVVQGVFFAIDGLAELAGIYPYDRELIEGDGVVDIVSEQQGGGWVQGTVPCGRARRQGDDVDDTRRRVHP